MRITKAMAEDIGQLVAERALQGLRDDASKLMTDLTPTVLDKLYDGQREIIEKLPEAWAVKCDSCFMNIRSDDGKHYVRIAWQFGQKVPVPPGYRELSIRVEDPEIMARFKGLDRMIRECATGGWNIEKDVSKNAMKARTVEKLSALWPDVADIITKVAAAWTPEVTVEVPLDSILKRHMPAALPAPQGIPEAGA